MPRSSVSKLVPPVAAKTGGRTKRQQYSASTRRTLVEVAEQLFTEQGYAATSLDQVVAGAEVTKGALYHHFSGKQALFEAVFERTEEDASRAIQQALQDRDDPWEKAQAGLHAFLRVVQEDRYRRVVVQEGPAVLGYERFREQEERSTFANVVDIVRSMLASGTWHPDVETTETFARLFFGAMSSAGEAVAAATDREAEAGRVETAVGFILAGFQVLAQSGSPLPNGLGPDSTGDPAGDSARDSAGHVPRDDA